MVSPASTQATASRAGLRAEATATAAVEPCDSPDSYSSPDAFLATEARMTNRYYHGHRHRWTQACATGRSRRLPCRTSALTVARWRDVRKPLCVPGLARNCSLSSQQLILSTSLAPSGPVRRIQRPPGSGSHSRENVKKGQQRRSLAIHRAQATRTSSSRGKCSAQPSASSCRVSANEARRRPSVRCSAKRSEDGKADGAHAMGRRRMKNV